MKRYIKIILIALISTIVFPVFSTKNATASFPAVQYSDTQLYGTASTNHYYTLPSNIDANDLLLLFVQEDDDDAIALTGWTDCGGGDLGAAILACYAKVAVGNEDSSQINIQTAFSEEMAISFYHITAESWSGNISEVEALGSSHSNSAPNPPYLSPGWGYHDFLWFAVAGSSSTLDANGAPTNYTNYVEDEGGTVGIASAYRELYTFSEDPGTFSMDNSGGTHFSMTVVVKGVPTPTATPTPTNTPTPTPIPGPSVTTNAASSIAQTTATINGTANPNGYSATGWFRYYTSNPGSCADSGGTRVPSSSGTALGSGSTGVAYNRDLTGLTPGTTYYVCAFASNSQGTGEGTVDSFSTAVGTPASVTNNGESSLGSYYTTLNGNANPNNFASYGFFRLYTSNPGSCTDSGGTRYPSSDTLDDVSLGSSGTGQDYSYTVSFGLSPQTTYYYCAFARNAYGTVASSVDSFVTPDGPISACDPPASGNHTISSSCSYSGSIGGVDGGTGTRNTAVLGIASGKQLTLNPDQQVAWGGITLAGSINIAPGSSLRGAPVWVVDADSDGYIAESDQYIGSQPEGGVRRNTVSSNYGYYSQIATPSILDCNDASVNVFQSVSSALDTDQDGYYTGSPASNCVGASSTANGRTYYNNTSGSAYYLASAQALGGSDCNDSDVAKWQDLTGYPDADSDSNGVLGIATTPGTAGTVSGTGGSGTSWSNTTNTTSSNNVDATVSLTSGSLSRELTLTNFGFSVSGTIRGIVVSIERAGSSSNSIVDSSIRLIKGGGASGTNQADTSTKWPTSDTTVVYGYATDLWGTTWTDTDINASNFGVHIKARNAGSGTRTADIDYVTITVYYGDGSSQICSGAALPSGYSGNSNDCYDGNASLSSTNSATAGGTDADNDGYFATGTGVSISYCGSGRYSGTGTADCYDSNNDAYPGQSAYFTSHRGDSSFDYNCDSTTTKDADYNCIATGTPQYACSTSGTAGAQNIGYVGSVPSCGQSGTYRACARTASNSTCTSPGLNDTCGDANLSCGISGVQSYSTPESARTIGCK